MSGQKDNRFHEVRDVGTALNEHSAAQDQIHGMIGQRRKLQQAPLPVQPGVGLSKFQECVRRKQVSRLVRGLT